MSRWLEVETLLAELGATDEEVASRLLAEGAVGPRGKTTNPVAVWLSRLYPGMRFSAAADTIYACGCGNHCEEPVLCPQPLWAKTPDAVSRFLLVYHSPACCSTAYPDVYTELVLRAQ